MLVLYRHRVVELKELWRIHISQRVLSDFSLSLFIALEYIKYIKIKYIKEYFIKFSREYIKFSINLFSKIAFGSSRSPGVVTLTHTCISSKQGWRSTAYLFYLAIEIHIPAVEFLNIVVLAISSHSISDRSSTAARRGRPVQNSAASCAILAASTRIRLKVFQRGLYVRGYWPCSWPPSQLRWRVALFQGYWAEASRSMRSSTGGPLFSLPLSFLLFFHSSCPPSPPLLRFPFFAFSFLFFFFSPLDPCCFAFLRFSPLLPLPPCSRHGTELWYSPRLQ